MEVALTILGVAVTVLAVHGVAGRLGVLSPILLIAVGVAASFVPGVPAVALTPDIVLLGLLPPLLYAAAIRTSLLDVRAHLTPILGLSVGLVLFTAAGVGLLVWLLLPVPYAVAFAAGAVVAPPDAVAATAVARRIGLPRPVVTILEGESLLNDATALVALRTAAAAAGLAIGHGAAQEGPVTWWGAGLDFLWASAGGVAVGAVVYAVLAAVRRRVTDPVADVAISFVAPFTAYLPAELAGVSGVLAVVTTGLLLGHRSMVLQNAPSRLAERTTWTSVTFLLENAVFLLIGLQMAGIVEDVRAGGTSLSASLALGVAVLLVVLVLRPVWIFPFRWVQDRLGRRSGRGGWRPAAVASWAGMRGVVTVAAALLLPPETPYRATFVLVALVVTVGTLLLQGTTLPWLARVLDVRGPDVREDALQRATVLQATTAAGLRTLEGDPDVDEDTERLLREQRTVQVNRVWERLGAARDDDRPTPSEAYRRARLRMLAAERAELLAIRDEGRVDQEVLAEVLAAMDVEESTLQVREARSADLRGSVLRAPDRVASACAHLAEAPQCVVPGTPQGCADCLREGTSWVHLRVCLACGHVGCCDSSPRRHADAHHRASTHPVIRSLEPGELWRWCFVDEVLG
ncbi:MAG TPA: Na+/H+ antiporter [Dermatophilaceae bacterium]|nr:Na+/H+ antiporter [Dermatophilaceae bacterium]